MDSGDFTGIEHLERYEEEKWDTFCPLHAESKVTLTVQHDVIRSLQFTGVARVNSTDIIGMTKEQVSGFF